MNKSITRAAGAEHGEELPPDAMERADRRARPQPRASAPRSTAMPTGSATTPPTPPRPWQPIQLEVAERWTGSLTESEKRRVLPKPRTPARVR